MYQWDEIDLGGKEKPNEYNHFYANYYVYSVIVFTHLVQ